MVSTVRLDAGLGQDVLGQAGADAGDGVGQGLKPGLKLEVKYKSPNGKWVSGRLIDEKGKVIAEDVWVTADPGLTQTSCSLDSVEVGKVPPPPASGEAKKAPEIKVGKEYELLRRIDTFSIS